MSNTYEIYLISDSTGETLDRIFLALKAQFLNIKYKIHSYSFTRTENQILKILEDASKNKNSIILYTIVDNNLAKYLTNKSGDKRIPCFGVLGNLILNFSKILNQKANHEPSGQHILNKEYYDRIEAIQFTMNHDDGNLINDIDKSDIILVGVSRTSKTPTSIYLANKGLKTSNIPLVNENSLPEKLKKNPRITCVIGLSTEPERLADLRKNRMNSLRETENIKYTDLENIRKEVLDAKKTFQKYKWPLIDVTRKSVEETAASIIKIHEIYLNNVK
jgi:regulator of PEP synthase PpsR (kinase-PPPase family)